MFHILLVDDDADVRRLVKKILEKSGYAVMAVENGLGALSELNENAYDLLISDANMPQYSGFDLIKAVRRLPKHKELPIAMLTGRREMDSIKQAIELGANDYIVKPVDPEVLLGKIQKLLSSRYAGPAVMNLPDAVKVDFEASFQCPLRMKKIGLNGFTAVSVYPLNVGQDFYLNIETLDYENLPKARVISCDADPGNPGHFVLNGVFLAMDDEFKDQIRNCLKKYTDAA